MFLLIRLSAYLVSGFVLWQAFHNGVVMPTFPVGRHLMLDPAHGMVFGVCAGISNFTGVDVTVIRILWVLAALYRGIGVALYVLAFLIMPTSS